MKALLSGIPEVRMQLNTKIPFTSPDGNLSIDIDDMSFHQCVHVRRWVDSNLIMFIPPTEPFTLLQYHITKPVSAVSIAYLLYDNIVYRLNR